MKRKKINNKFGVTLAEVSVAILIFVLAAIPLYYAVSYGAKEEIQIEKTALANKILEAFRDECKNLDYDTVESYGPETDGSNLPQNTFGELLKAQQKHKDFKFHATIKAPDNAIEGIDSLQINADVKWTKEKGGESIQKISFVKIKH